MTTAPNSTISSSSTNQKAQLEEDKMSSGCVNFMSKFRDKDTRVLKNLNSSQFIEVWNNYDKDGELLLPSLSSSISLWAIINLEELIF